MALLDIVAKKKYPKLYEFCIENNLSLWSCFGATDLDCAYRFQIVSEPRDILGYSLDGFFRQSIMIDSYPEIPFSWTLVNINNYNKDEVMNYN